MVWLRLVRSSGASPEYCSGWVLQLVHLILAENHPDVEWENIRGLHSITKSHVELHHMPLDPPISHNFLSKLQYLKTFG